LITTKHPEFPTNFEKNYKLKYYLFKAAKIWDTTLEPISKIRLGFRARRGTAKKRSIHAVCEHFEPFYNAAMGT
jgi:hypothetical protein